MLPEHFQACCSGSDEQKEMAEDAIWNVLPSQCAQGLMMARSMIAKSPISPSYSESPRSAVDDTPKGRLAELLVSRYDDNDSMGGSPLHPTNLQSSTEKAAQKMGYRSKSSGLGDVSETLKSIGGSFKDLSLIHI